MIADPNPGIYYGVPFHEYLAWNCVSNSRLSLMAKSPRHYLTPAPFSSAAVRLGSLVHCGKLETLALSERYAVASDWHLDDANVTDAGRRSDSKSTLYYKEKASAFAEANKGREIVTREEYDTMAEMVKSIEANPKARKLFSEPGAVEVSMVWDDPETGVRCKGRIDKLGRRRFGDLKTTADITDAAKSIAKYGYHRQQAFYRTGWAVLNGGELLEAWLCFVESKPPHCVMAAPLSELSLAAGEHDYRNLLRRVQQCHLSGKWPGPPSPDEWEIPEWAMPNLLTCVE